jgi:hypothetical protein
MSADRFQNGPKTRKGPHREVPGWAYVAWVVFSTAFIAFLFFIQPR